MVLLHYRKPWVKALNSFLKIMNLKNTTTMKKFYTIMLALLLSSIAAQAQEADYQPLVREGVRWVNVNEKHYEADLCYFYCYEFRGDTIINGKTYKKCYKYTGDTLNLSKDTAYCAMRDEGHKVYEVPFGDADEIWFELYLDELQRDGEFELFDFDNPRDPYAASVALRHSRIIAKTADRDRYIPGVGYNGEWDGDAFHPFTPIPTSEYYDTYGFHHLEDLAGNIIYEGAAFDREEYIYPRLAREGVVWEYLFVNEDLSMCVERFQILGDTIISGHRYDRLFRYFSDRLDTTETWPVAYVDDVVFMGEGARDVNVCTAPVAAHDPDEFMSDFGDTYTLPAGWWYSDYEHTGARDIYNFDGILWYMQDINQRYGCDDFSADEHPTKVRVGDQMNRCFDITGIGMVDGKWIEGVGIDGLHTGNLIAPLAPSGETGTQGLIRLADLDGNTLYEGAYYSYYSGITQVDHDAKVSADPRWFDLLGRPHETRPTQPGIYIHQGRKVVVK